MGTIIHDTYLTEIGMVSWGSGGMKVTALSSLHDVLHATVFWIVLVLVRQGKKKHVRHGVHAHTTRWGPYSLLPPPPPTEVVLVSGGWH